MAMNQKGKKILRTIYSMQGVSRPCLLKMSRYTPPTLYRIIDELVRDGYVVVSGTGDEGGKGRPTDLLSLNGALGQVAALHISRTAFSCAVLDFSDRMLACRRHTIEPSLTPGQWAAAVRADLNEMCAQLALRPPPCAVQGWPPWARWTIKAGICWARFILLRPTGDGYPSERWPNRPWACLHCWTAMPAPP